MTACSQQVPKMYLYSCHDSSLVPLLIAMGCYDNKWPPYTADITFELYEDAERQRWVNVSYCGKVCNYMFYFDLTIEVPPGDE
jgi:Histidine phosphatase superfamily (branch 2)